MIDYDSDASILTATQMRTDGTVACPLPNGTVALGEIGGEWGLAQRMQWTQVVRDAAKHQMEVGVSARVTDSARGNPDPTTRRVRGVDTVSDDLLEAGEVVGISPETLILENYERAKAREAKGLENYIAALRALEEAKRVAYKWKLAAEAIGVSTDDCDRESVPDNSSDPAERTDNGAAPTFAA